MLHGKFNTRYPDLILFLKKISYSMFFFHNIINITSALIWYRFYQLYTVENVCCLFVMQYITGIPNGSGSGNVTVFALTMPFILLLFFFTFGPKSLPITSAILFLTFLIMYNCWWEPIVFARIESSLRYMYI